MALHDEIFPIFRCTAIALGCAVLASCGAVNTASEKVAEIVTPYRIEIVQGNFVSREQVEALKPGMSRLQVQELLGTPLVTSIFHGDRWDYVFTMKRPNVAVLSRKLSVFFEGDVLSRFESDDMPSEKEFVGMIDTPRGKLRKVPLQASQADLAKYAKNAEKEGASSSSDAVMVQPQPTDKVYPALE